MEFEVLGPLRVRACGQPVPLTATMPRTLLAILLARANTFVPVDVLVDGLWSGRRDPRAVKKLQLHVHRLRRALGHPTRIRFDSGYLLVVRPGELDADRFESALTDGLQSQDPLRAMRLIRAALGLWRGEPFGNVADVTLLRAEADRLTERRLVGLEELYADALACGQAREIVPELRDLAALHPLRERLQGLLMTALYQGDRRAEALEVYHRTRSALVDDLALEPGPELRRLEHAILTGDPMLSAPTTPPAQLPPDIPDFVGRVAEIARISQHLTGPTSTTPVVGITGMAGVGKTALAVHVARRLRGDYPHGQLYVDLRGRATPSSQARPLDAEQVLARFLRALGVTGAAVPADVAERAALYRSRLADRRVLLVLDNAAEAAQLRPLLPAAPGCAVLVTSRTRLATLPGIRQVHLTGLEPDQGVELLAQAAGRDRVAAEPAAAHEVVRWCDGLPLALRIAGIRLRNPPHRRLERLAAGLRDDQDRLNQLRFGDLDVRAGLAASYHCLPAVARRAFRYLGLLPSGDFPSWVLAALLDTDESQAEDLLDGLVDAQLLAVSGCDGAGRDGDGQVHYRCDGLLWTFARELVTGEPGSERLAALDRVSAASNRRFPEPSPGTVRAQWAPHASAPGIDLADSGGFPSPPVRPV